MNIRPLVTALIPLVVLTACGTGRSLLPAAPKTNATPLPAPIPAQLPVPTTLPEPPLAPPSTPTVLVTSAYALDGVLLPTVRGQQLVETKLDMRRTDTLQSFDNRLLRAVAGSGYAADIVRLDRKLIWSLNPAKLSYTECPLSGCTRVGQPAPDKPVAEQPAQPGEPSCPLTLSKNDLRVTTTGERKVINNFGTERIQISWTMELEDKQRRRNVNQVLLDMWTTAEVGRVKDVQMTNQAFDKRWAGLLAKSENPLGAYVPREVMGAMGSLMNNLGANNSKFMATWPKEMKKVRGYPIAMTITWNAEGNACGETLGGGEGAGPASAAAVLGNLMGAASPGKKSNALVSYSYEVKAIEVKQVSDVWFAPDANYRRAP